MSTETDTTAEESATTREPEKIGVFIIDPKASRADLIREIHERLFDVDEIANQMRGAEFGTQLYRTEREALAMFEVLVEWDSSELEPRAQWALKEGS